GGSMALLVACPGARPRLRRARDSRSSPRGVQAICRGLSAEIPPIRKVNQIAPPKGCQNLGHRVAAGTEICPWNAASPPGSSARSKTPTGGIAALNPRLIAETPHGVTFCARGNVSRRRSDHTRCLKLALAWLVFLLVTSEATRAQEPAHDQFGDSEEIA